MTRGLVAVWLVCACSGDDGGTPTDSGTVGSDSGTDSSPEPTDTTTTTTELRECPAPWTQPEPSRAGCTSQRADDYDFNGQVDARTLEFYSADGHVERIERDVDLDGDPEFVQVDTYDSNTGLLLLQEQDQGADGVFEITITFTHDAAGLLTGWLYTEPGFTQRATFTNGPCGAVVEEYDIDDDGTVDHRIDSVWTGSSRVASEDVPVDGVIDRVVTYTFDPRLGRPLGFADDNDFELDGPEFTVDITYDDAGRKALESLWIAPDLEASVVYEYDAEGRPSEIVNTYANGTQARATFEWTCP